MSYKQASNNLQICNKCGELIQLDPTQDVCKCYICFKEIHNHTKGHFIYKLSKMLEEVNKQNEETGRDKTTG